MNPIGFFRFLLPMMFQLCMPSTIWVLLILPHLQAFVDVPMTGEPEGESVALTVIYLEIIKNSVVSRLGFRLTIDALHWKQHQQTPLPLLLHSLLLSVISMHNCSSFSIKSARPSLRLTWLVCIPPLHLIPGFLTPVPPPIWPLIFITLPIILPCLNPLVFYFPLEDAHPSRELVPQLFPIHFLFQTIFMLHLFISIYFL